MDSADMDSADALEGFGQLTKSWFSLAFSKPTPAQAGAWHAIREGCHTLVVAPTGSGKTLAAFMHSIDTLATATTTPPKKQRCSVLYISPLKALASDVERNLRSPLTGIRREAARINVAEPDITVGIRTGDTPQDERRRMVTTPPDILITTPESLFLLLTSAARESLRGVKTVIIDEIHAVAGTKRGAHLAVSLERLDALLDRPAQRIGLSATVQPIDEVALFLGGTSAATVVAPPADKQIEIKVVVPVEDLSMPSPTPIGDPHAEILEDEPVTPSIWPHVENGIVDLVESHRSTLVFANSRRLAERLTARLNEIHAERYGFTDETPVEGPPPEHPPAQIMANSGATKGAGLTLARAHHGSVSKEQRGLIEDDLKAGRIPAVVATSSLELGIDMGAVDLVIQVEAPPSVASGLQRVGRAGHHVGEVSRAVIFPKHRGDLLASAVVTQQMNARALETTRVPRNPLDVLAQHIVAAVSIEDIDANELLATIRRAAPFHSLPQSAYDGVLDMLAGRYPSDGFAELRPRIVWDRLTNTLTSRPGAQRLAVTSGGTIPDRGLFGVFMVGEKASRVGELDEEMVYESRVGDVFALGATSWRIEDITHDRVLVSPAPGQVGRLPFWHGDSIGRPFELGRAIGAFTGKVASASFSEASADLQSGGLDQWASENLVRYIHEQAATTGRVPDDRTLVVEKFRDELGDWRVVLHSPFGARVHAPWALAVSARVQELTGVDAQVMHADDGIVLRIPDTDDDTAVQAAIDALFADPDDIAAVVTNALGGSALFASRFRECSARALLLPRRDPTKRTPLWQQRQRSAQLLSVAAQYPSFPIVIETIRECLQDVYDLPALTSVLRDIRSRAIEVTYANTATPSPFARTLLFSYVASFLYEGDSPLAERKASALTLDTELLAELLGYVELRELLDADAINEVEAEISMLAAQRHARTVEHAADMIRQLGPLTLEDLGARGIQADWITQLVDQRRVIEVRIAGQYRFSSIEDAGRLRDSLGIALPVGIPDAFLEPGDDPLADLFSRYTRTHGPFTSAQAAEHFGIGPAVANSTLDRLAATGNVVSGEFRPGGSGTEWCNVEVLRRMRRRSIAALRQEAEPVPPAALGMFLPMWSGITTPKRGVDAVLHSIEQLAGTSIPATVWESAVLPARVSNYQPAMLDELMSAGEVVWCGRGRLSSNDGWISMAPAESASLLLPDPLASAHPSDVRQGLLDALEPGGAWLVRELADRIPDVTSTGLQAALWDLVWDGLVTSDTLAGLRGLLASGANTVPQSSGSAGSAHRPRRPAGGAPRTRAARLSQLAAGRWSMAPKRVTDPTRRITATTEALLNRYGVLTRGSVAAEGIAGGFAASYRVLAALEDNGRTRRGYFIEGLGAAQFATPGAVDQLRHQGTLITNHEPGGPATTTVLAACDPANPFGAALPWPGSGDGITATHRPGRKAGAHVVMSNGELVIFLEKGGKSVLTFTADPELLTGAVGALAEAGRSGRVGIVKFERVNGQSVSTSDLAPILEQHGFVFTPSGMRLPPR